MVSGSRRVGRQRARNKIQTETKASRATRALGYLRVSTEEQAATGHGLEAQEKSVRAFAESQAYELVEVLTDPGVSGATKPADRPAFGRALELAAAGAFDVLLVAKIDRLSRDIRQPDPGRLQAPGPPRVNRACALLLLAGIALASLRPRAHPATAWGLPISSTLH